MRVLSEEHLDLLPSSTGLGSRTTPSKAFAFPRPIPKIPRPDERCRRDRASTSSSRPQPSERLDSKPGTVAIMRMLIVRANALLSRSAAEAGRPSQCVEPRSLDHEGGKRAAEATRNPIRTWCGVTHLDSLVLGHVLKIFLGKFRENPHFVAVGGVGFFSTDFRVCHTNRDRKIGFPLNGPSEVTAAVRRDVSFCSLRVPRGHQP
jgi:hypothetical protein